MPSAGFLPDAVRAGYERDSEGNLILDDRGDPIPIQEQRVTQMDDPTKVAVSPIRQTQPEQVSTGEATRAGDVSQFETERMTPSTITEEVSLDAATGSKNDIRIAEAAGVADVPTIEGARVDVEPEAVASFVTGVLSDTDKYKAAKNAGTSLQKITRAKTQLRNAGLSEEQIEAIGNDPEDLEARLADLPEEDRGLIAGLPKEALISTQLDNLLNGLEEGNIPTWAKPAVSAVESMLARRGMSASTVGRDSLLNAIIQSSIPIAQANAQAIQMSISQQRTMEAQEPEANTARQQQMTMQKMSNVFNMDMAQFSADQQTELFNSKFFQTVSLTNANNNQQAAIQNVVLQSQADLATADFYQKAQIQNAQNFLTMDLTNLNNKQQANILSSQQEQQRILSNQAAINASEQFNATSENQTQQFMSNLSAQIDLNNSARSDAMNQFNATQENAAEARRLAQEADAIRFESQLLTQVDQFNSQQDFARNQWNAQNAATIEASNVQWRRQTNLADTAAQNQINAQNAQNAFGMSSQALAFLWQELRDQADFDFRAFENEENRKVQIVATAIANEGKAGEKYGPYLSTLVSSLSTSYAGGFGG